MSKQEKRPVVRISMTSDNLSALSSILQKGVVIDATVECTLTEFLSDQLGLDREYVDTKLSTIFLDGKPVDDLNEAIVRNGSIVALSAALPGLAGATYRRGSHYAALRRNVSYIKDQGQIKKKDGMVVLKLFNMVIADLARGTLEQGIWVGRNDIEKILEISRTESRAIVIDNEQDIFDSLRQSEGTNGMMMLQVRIR